MEIIAEVHSKTNPAVPIWGCLSQYGVCARSIISPMSVELWNLYNAIGGTSRIARPRDYYELPALYVDAVGVIEREIKRIAKAKPKNDGDTH